MAVKKSFSSVRASATKIVTAAGYSAAAIELTARVLVVASARLNEYLSEDLGPEATRLVAQIDSELHPDTSESDVH